MKRFVLKILIFVSLLALSFSLFFLLPPTPWVTKANIFAEKQKRALLENTPSPRIIFVGGSNVCFGLNSQLIKDSLQLNPINTAIAQSLGIKYILESLVPYIKKGDIIVLAPEYRYFVRDWHYGSENLLRIVVDCDKTNIRFLSPQQMYNCVPYVGKFILSKFDRNEYIHTNVDENIVYSVNAFNKYGDVDAHWNLEKQEFDWELEKPMTPEMYNPQIISGIKSIANELQKKGSIVLIAYPGYPTTSFNNSTEAIKKIEEEYRNNGFTTLGNPERYIMPDSLMFDLPGHLNKQGTDRRTQLLIEDLKSVLGTIDSLGILK
ncbi:MAG: hypothetical protein FWC39_06225 [Bacteroidetes bacterium]|nr:hypothetical protein [Bacteroidota bacterium]